MLVDPLDYAAAVGEVIRAAETGQPLSVSALAVHGVMTGFLDAHHRYRLNRLNLVLPDGQPVRWALRALYGERLSDRVYGPTLTLKVCEVAASRGLPVYLYGSRPEVLKNLSENLQSRFPGLQIAGTSPSLFRQTSDVERDEISQRIRDSGARITFVGLGCPRQEVWAYEYRSHLSMPILAVGAAFDFHAGTLAQAPAWMQDNGLEWAFRLGKEPRRLWRRYLGLNPLFVLLLGLQLVFGDRLWAEREASPGLELLYG